MANQHSDYCNTSDPTATPISGGVLVLEYWVDGDGYVLRCAKGKGAPDIRCTIRNPRLGEVLGNESGAVTAEFNRSEIVWPQPGWPVDAAGRGLSVMEVQGRDSIRLEERRTARFIREWEEQNATHHAAIITRFAA